MHAARYRSACLWLVLVTLVACNKSPTSPSPGGGSGTATRIIGLSGNLDFGEVAVGASRDATLTITNTGTAALSVTGLSVTGGLGQHLSANPTSGQVPAGGSLPIVIRFTPVSAGSFNGTLTVNADHTGGSNTISLSGVGASAPIAVIGVVSNSTTRAPVVNVRVSVLRSGGQPVGSTTTDGNGYYSLVVPSSTPLSVSYSADGYNFQSATVTFTVDTRRDINLVPLWTAEGIGNTVFNMPTFVTRVRITGTYRASGSNFIVYVGGRLVVNEIIGTARQGGPTYTGIHAVTGGEVRIENSRDVEWSFQQQQ